MPMHQQGQVPIPMQPTGGSYGAPPHPHPQQQQQQQQPYYQQGAPVPLFAQTTGGSIIQQQQSPHQESQPPLPTGGSSELANNQIQHPQQPHQQ